MQIVQTSETISFIESYLDKENDENHDTCLDISELLDYLLNRMNCNTNKQLSSIRLSILKVLLVMLMQS